LDAIVTQLLHQMDGSGPHALGKHTTVLGILKEN
jgi:hypothetical protein